MWAWRLLCCGCPISSLSGLWDLTNTSSICSLHNPQHLQPLPVCPGSRRALSWESLGQNNNLVLTGVRTESAGTRADGMANQASQGTVIQQLFFIVCFLLFVCFETRLPCVTLAVLALICIEFRYPPVSASQVMGLEACATMLRLLLDLKIKCTHFNQGMGWGCSKPFLMGHTRLWH